jgi:hypothetical protein
MPVINPLLRTRYAKAVKLKRPPRYEHSRISPKKRNPNHYAVDLCSILMHLEDTQSLEDGAVRQDSNRRRLGVWARDLGHFSTSL